MLASGQQQMRVREPQAGACRVEDLLDHLETGGLLETLGREEGAEALDGNAGVLGALNVGHRQSPSQLSALLITPVMPRMCSTVVLLALCAIQRMAWPLVVVDSAQ